MKKTTLALSWILVASALSVAACGDRAESHHSTIRKGTGADGAANLEKLDTNLPDADASLTGMWLDMSPTTKDGITQTIYWQVDLPKKVLTISMICDSDNKAMTAISQASTKIEAKRNDLLLKDQISTSKPFKTMSGKQVECQLENPPGRLHYNLNGNLIEILNDTNEPVAQLCAASMGASNRPIAKDGCNKTPQDIKQTEAKKVTTVDVPELTDLSALTDEESQKALEAEGSMSFSLKNKVTRWKSKMATETDSLSKKEVGSFLVVSFGKFTAKGSDSMMIQKRCFSADNKVSVVDVTISPKALLTGKRIRFLDETLSKKVEAKGDAPACELSMAKEDISYAMTGGKLSLKQVVGDSVILMNLEAIPLDAVKNTEKK